MTAPAGVVDLSLPDYPTLVARAGVDPRTEAARVAGADPATVAGTGALLSRAGGEMDAAYTRSTAAADTLGQAFTNGGAPVLDRATHVANLPAGFGDAGARLAGTSRRVGAVADDLSATMRLTADAVTGMDGDLSAAVSSWLARVAAAGTAGGLIPQEAIPGLRAERDRVATQMVATVSDAGRRVVERIRGYEVVLNEALRLLADQGFVAPAELDVPPPPPPARTGDVDPAGLGTPITAGYAADPVNTALGNFVEVETDLAFGGLTFARTYNSRSDRSGPFGARWASWATTRLVEHAWTAEFEGPDGQRVAFPRTGSRFGRAVGIDALVERAETGLALAWFDGRRWEFDATGRLVSTWAGPGTAVRFVHDDDRLVELVHERGRRLAVEWDGERIVAVSGSGGRRVDHRYDLGRLVEAAGPAGARHYGYDEAGRVASVTDADGVVELVNTYDEHGRVLTQRSPLGRTVTFSYAADGVTVVADDVEEGAAGPTNTYRHDHAGRLVAVTDGHGRTLRKRYDAWGNLVEIVERGGGVTRQEFDDRGHLVRRTAPSGAEFALTWDDADRVTTVATAGACTRFTYTGAERVPSEIVDPEGGRTRLQVTGGLVTTVVDPDGVAVRLRHDADGRLVEAVDGAGGVARIERDAAGLPSAVVTPAGRRTELVHDAHGRLVERRDPAGGVWRHEYTAAGRLAATVDPTGARTATRYGPHGQAAELVDALGAVTTRGYDAFGNLALLTEPGGAKWAFRHDALSRLTAWTDPAGGTWWQDHDVEGRPTASTDPTGARIRVTYDQAGHVTGLDDGLVVTGRAHDQLGRLVAEHRMDGTSRTFTYDRCDRLVAETGPDGGTTRYTYSPAGRLTRVEAPSGRTERLLHDARGRVTALVDGAGQRWELRHDPDGLLVERISPAGLVETLDRDAGGRVTRHRIPGRGTTVREFDAAGRVVAIADRAGRREFTRDAAGRVVAATDALGHTTRYTWSPRGDLSAVTDPLGGVTRYEHDELGRPTAATDPLGRTTGFVHDAAGRLVEQHEPTGVRHRWAHDPSGRPRSITASSVDATVTIAVERDTLARPVRVTGTGCDPIDLRWDAGGRLVERRAGGRAIGWSYDADGLRTALTHPDGTVTRYRRDGAGRVVGLEHPLLGRVDLHRDPDGRLLGLGDLARCSYTDGWLTGHDRGGQSTRLTRDEQGRVVAAETDGRAQLFGYDAAGQLVGAAGPDGERGLTYDAAGRLVAESGPGGDRRYTYDAAGQLTSSAGPDGPRHYAYDAAGRRTGERGVGHERSFRWDPLGRLTGVDTTAGGGTRSTVLTVDALGELARVGDVPLAWDTADPAGALLAIGEQVVGFAHPALVPELGADPWGGDAAGCGVGRGFRGELAVDGLVWLRARAYDPATRAFLSPDPLPAVPGTAYAANPYHYAGNDPVDNVDPLGLRPVTDAELAGEHDKGGGLLSAIGHGVLDVAGLVPVVGEAADLANAAWYTAEGDYTMAALSAAAAIPFAGWVATGGKFGVKAVKAVKTVDGARAWVKGKPSMVPWNATRTPWSPNAKFAYGESYQWTADGTGKTVRYHAHGPDPSRPVTENAGAGPVYRIKEGNKYLDANGNGYTENAISNPASSKYSPTAANDTHIPYPKDQPPPTEPYHRVAVPNPAALFDSNGSSSE